MKKIKLTLSIDKNILKRYKEICLKDGLIISKQIEKYMERKIKR